MLKTSHIIGLCRVIILLTIASCGANMYEVHVNSAIAVRHTLSTVKHIIEDDMQRRSVAAASDPTVDVHQAEINAHAVIRQYDGIIAAHQAAVDAYSVWVTGLVKALGRNESSDNTTMLIILAKQFISAYEQLLGEAGKLAIKIPLIDDVMDYVYND